MEEADKDRIREIAERHFELRKLYDEHKALEERLSTFEKRGFLTVPEEMEEKRLKKRKLRGVDKMMHILSSEDGALEDRNRKAPVVESSMAA